MHNLVPQYWKQIVQYVQQNALLGTPVNTFGPSSGFTYVNNIYVQYITYDNLDKAGMNVNRISATFY